MNRFFYLLPALALLAACRESNLTTQSPTAPAASERTLRLDTTFLELAQRNRAFQYQTRLRVGTGADTTAIPVEIDWTATPHHGCPQVASVRVYQLGAAGGRAALQASVRRDSTCHAALGPNGQLSTASAGLALVSIGGAPRGGRLATTSTCLLNGLGYHDSLSYARPAGRR